jgi:predicted GNAT family acetyltransferase
MASTDNDDDISALNTGRNSLEHPSKRKKTSAVDQYADEDVEDIVPVSMSSEDISEEVQQRLKQIEEKRKMRAYQQQGRKRLRADQEYTIPNEEVIPTTKRVKHPKSGKEQP